MLPDGDIVEGVQFRLVAAGEERGTAGPIGVEQHVAGAEYFAVQAASFADSAEAAGMLKFLHKTSRCKVVIHHDLPSGRFCVWIGTFKTEREAEDLRADLIAASKHFYHDATLLRLTAPWP
jgi:hypothetical protein